MYAYGDRFLSAARFQWLRTTEPVEVTRLVPVEVTTLVPVEVTRLVLLRKLKRGDKIEVIALFRQNIF